MTADFVSVAGFLDAYETGTGYAILPVVGLLSGGFALVAGGQRSGRDLRSAARFSARSREPRIAIRANGRAASASSTPSTYDGHYIWGATAAILVNFRDRLCAMTRLDPKTTAWMRAEPLAKVMRALTRDGGDARYVGGAVRNALLGVAVNDVDIATPLDAR